jgi:hypothetical protein
LRFGKLRFPKGITSFQSGPPARKGADLVRIRAITDYVIVSTPFASNHVKRLTLAEMQKQSLISSPNQTRKNIYKDGTIIIFPRAPARQT